MKIKLAGSKIINFNQYFVLGQVVDAEIKGYINSLSDAYEIIVDGKVANSSYFPVCNGLGEDGKKYLVCTQGKKMDQLYAFVSKHAYIGE